MNAPPPSRPATPAPTVHLVLAFAALYLIWGSTYLGMAIAIETMPPFLMAAVRFAIAGMILIAVRRALGDRLPDAGHWCGAAVVGGLLFVGGNGAVAWAQQWVPSGIAALLIAATPFWMTVVPWTMGHAPRPGLVTLGGIAIGITGVALLVAAPLDGPADGMLVGGALVILAASFSWALGSLLARRLPAPSSPWMASGAQMVCGAIGLGLLSLTGGEMLRFEVTAVSLRSWLALAYLIVIGAILGFSAYVYLLRHTSMAKVSTYAFVNPAVAVVLGWLVLGEPITLRTLVAGGLIIVAVVLILRPVPATRVEMGARSSA